MLIIFHTVKRRHVRGGMKMTTEKPLEVKISEKYYIEKGQGIDQLLAVSLDEHIRLHEFPSFIQLKGELVLEGEFAKEDGVTVPGEKQQYPQRKYMQSIQQLEDGVAYFRQIIPVDITIPKSSVRHIEDIRVNISHFDYSIPTPHIFILFATLLVKGILKEEEREQEEDVVSDEVVEQVEEVVEVAEVDILEDNHDTLENEKVDISEEVLPVLKEVIADEEEPEILQSVAEELAPIMETEQEVDSSFSEEEEVAEVVYEGRSFLDDLFGEERAAQVTMYVVQVDDSLVSIAEKFELSPAEISRHNREVVDDLAVGSVLTIYR